MKNEQEVHPVLGLALKVQDLARRPWSKNPEADMAELVQVADQLAAAIILSYQAYDQAHPRKDGE